MSKINLFVTNANDILKDQENMIKKAVKTAEQYAFNALKIDWDIDLIVTSHIPSIVIPEDGVGGRTHWCDLIEVCIDKDTITENKLSEMIAHELCHAARWGKNDEYMQTLFDGIINEGIATYFESVFVKNRKTKQFFLETVTNRNDETNEKILNILKDQFDNEHYDYNTIFFSGDDSLPRWSGYSLGYYLVKKYLEKTNKTIEDAFTDKYSNFKIVI